MLNIEKLYGVVAFIIGDEEYCYDCGIETIKQLGLTEEEIIPVLEFEEVDSPRHCVVCETLLPYILTSEGVEYVINNLRNYIERGTGRVEILKQWAEDVKQYDLDSDSEKILKLFYKAVGIETEENED